MNAPGPVVEVVAGIIWRRGCYLGVRRPEGKPMAGAYEFPGGKIEAGESPEAALRRELAEELGITPTLIAFFCEKAHAYAQLSVHLRFFHVHGYAGELRALEGQDMEWLTPEQALARPFLAADTEVVEALAALETAAASGR